MRNGTSFTCGRFEIPGGSRFLLPFAIGLCLALISNPGFGQDGGPLELVRQQEQQRATVIQSVIGSVVAIYDEARNGGGSGVIIDPSGLALTNHHVIMGAGVSGMAGLADGKLYPWELVATDPGGDLALIRLSREGSFPHAGLADSDRVRAGDWAMAMGNPFVLAEDHVPTVTLGIVSGVKRYQPGSGKNQLVYGNCIQADSSINPGNSGGPLFDMSGAIIGINGRASFLERGRVNVGLGYAISSNQARNFLGELMATYLVQHGTLDASFSDYTDKGVLCSTINEYSEAAKAGLELADRLVELEGIPVHSSNQVASLLCTLPRGWPTTLLVRKPDGREQLITVRMTGLPYQQPPEPPQVPADPDQPEDKEQQRQAENQKKMQRLLSAGASTIRDRDLNHVCRDVLLAAVCQPNAEPASEKLEIRYDVSGEVDTGVQIILFPDRTFEVLQRRGDVSELSSFNGTVFNVTTTSDGDSVSANISHTSARQTPAILAALSIAAMSGNRSMWFDCLGESSVDGSDKADGKPVVRLKTLDDEKDWFYSWVSPGFADADRGSPSELVKVSADLNCDLKSGGVVFRDWQSVNGWRVPGQILFVSGLDEKVNRTWRLVPSQGEPGNSGDSP